MTTRYGTIPTATSSPGEWFRSDFGTLRPWNEMVSFSLPGSFKDSISRIKTNISYFHMNYSVIILLVLFLCLLWRPLSLILFVALMAAWLFLYFLRDEPVIILGRVVDERVVVVVLIMATVVFILTRATASIVVGVLVGVVVALLHAALRKDDDLILSNQEDSQGGAARLPLKETASSSYSSSSL